MSDSVQFIDWCKAGKIDALKPMIEVDPSIVNSRADDRIPAIIHATCANKIDVVDLLISCDADIEAKDSDFKATALGFAAWYGCADIAALLVERGADVDGMGEDPSPLALALDGVDGKPVQPVEVMHRQPEAGAHFARQRGLARAAWPYEHDALHFHHPDQVGTQPSSVNVVNLSQVIDFTYDNVFYPE